MSNMQQATSSQLKGHMLSNNVAVRLICESMVTSSVTQRRKRRSLTYDRVIGYVLAKARENAGRSQLEVARLFGCNQSLVSKMELGQRSVKVSEIPLLAVALDIPEHELRALLLAVLDVPEDELLSLLADLSADDVAL